MDEDLPNNAVVSGKLDRTLMIINAQKSNQGAYRCDYKINNTEIKTDSGFSFVIGEYSLVTGFLFIVIYNFNRKFYHQLVALVTMKVLTLYIGVLR